MIRKLGLLCLIGVLSGPPAGWISAAFAQGAPATDCDRLAAEADDVERTAPAVADEALDPALAVPACEAAVAQRPDSRRLVFQLGRAYLKAANLNGAFARFHDAAEQGHVLAQTYLGALYLEGSGTAKDDVQAALWFRKAADAGDSVAQYNLATLFETGRGVPKDNAEAAAWYRKSAEQGFSLAQVSLGRLLAAGQGVTQDVREAAEWYRKAAEQGDESAQYRLATMYADGQGVPKDAEQAIAWFRKAADKGYLDAAARLVALEAAQPKQPAATPPAPMPLSPQPAQPPATAAAPSPAAPAAAAPAAAVEGEHAKGGSTFFRVILAVVGAAVIALAALLFMVTRKRSPRPVDRQLESLKAEARIADAIERVSPTVAPAAPESELSAFAAELEAIPPSPASEDGEAAAAGPDGDADAQESDVAAEADAEAPAATDAGKAEPAMKRCSQCQKEIPTNDYFCCHCGALAIRFSDCQHDVREDARFCPRCGAILRWATQRPSSQVAAGGST